MSPFEHGEVFVLDDGGEVCGRSYSLSMKAAEQADLDLGNYERFLGIRLTRDHNITTGKVGTSLACLQASRLLDVLASYPQ